MFKMTEVLAGTFMDAGGTTENSMGLEVICGATGAGTLLARPYLFSMELPDELDLSRIFVKAYYADCGPQTTAVYLANVNSISISVAPVFLKGSLNF